MNPLLPLLSLSVLFVCSVEGNPVYDGKSLAEWKTETQPEVAISERQKAIQAMESLARERIGRRRPEDVSWVESEIVPTLIELLHDKEPTIRVRAAHTFHWFPEASKPATRALIEHLSDPSNEVRVAAAGALVSISPRDAQQTIPMLAEVIEETRSAAIRSDAAEVLARIGPEGVECLVTMLDDENSDVSRAVISTVLFYRRATPQALPKLTKLLRNEDATIRGSAVSIIANIRPITKEAVSAIMPLLQDEDVGVRRAVLSGLGEMQADAKQVLPGMVKLVDDDDGWVRDTLANSLGAMGPETVPILTKLLDDKLAYVRGHAADSLGQIGPAAKDAVPALKRLLTDMSQVGDEGVLVCHHAGKALARILGDKSYFESLPAIPIDGK